MGGVFIQSRVSVRGCSFKPSSELSLIGIEIKREGAYDITIKEAKVQFDLFSLFKPGSLKLILKEARVFVNTPNKGIRELSGYLKLRSGGAAVFGYAEVKDAKLDLNTQDSRAKAALSCGINILGQSADYLNLKLAELKLSAVQLEDAFLELKQGLGRGTLNLSKVKYDKLNITDIKGAIKLEGKTLFLSSLSARALDGDLQGDFNCEMDKGIQFIATLKFIGLDIEQFVRDFNLREKFNMTGRLKGELVIGGSAWRIAMLKGDFFTLEPGGMLVIKDTKFLENMARRTRQPLDLLVESFKNYGYNVGLMTLGIEESNIIFKMTLEGEAGKRNLSVVLHDFDL
ncbi:MAG: YdbH domain-containing protein [Candidatus Omnitrophota bacterium]